MLLVVAFVYAAVKAVGGFKDHSRPSGRSHVDDLFESYFGAVVGVTVGGLIASVGLVLMFADVIDSWGG